MRSSFHRKAEFVVKSILQQQLAGCDSLVIIGSSDLVSAGLSVSEYKQNRLKILSFLPSTAFYAV